MKDVKKFFLNLFSSKSEISSKRFISFLAFIMMSIGFLSNLYFNYDVEEHMYKSMEWIVEIGLGTILLEPFTRKKDENKDTNTNQPISTTGNTQTQSVDMNTGTDPIN